jgi:hypothetical protein
MIKTFARWWSNMISPGATPLNAAQLPFKVGDRVQDIFGDKNTGTVTRIDVRAEHGLGLITVKYDDGREIYSAAIAHGLVPIQNDAVVIKQCD